MDRQLRRRDVSRWIARSVFEHDRIELVGDSLAGITAAPYFEPPWHQGIMYRGWSCSPFYVTADLIWLNARILWTLLQLAAVGMLHWFAINVEGKSIFKTYRETGVVALRVSFKLKRRIPFSDLYFRRSRCKIV